MTAPYWINLADNEDFPDVALALQEPNGLLAIGGDLSAQRLLSAYRQGIFPWYSEGQPILWWSPDPRATLFPDKIVISRSLSKTLKKRPFTLTLDTAFSQVITECAKPRKDGQGTWITQEMQDAYIRLHAEGHAHSVECWQDDQLVGGLYGVAMGRVFFGESMFSSVTDASKVAFVHLVAHLRKWNFVLIDCQVESAHVSSLGAKAMPRKTFRHYLDTHCAQNASVASGKWSILPDLSEEIANTGRLPRE